MSLSPCHIPGVGATFHIADDEIEVGLGVHGEAGVRRMKVIVLALVKGQRFLSRNSRRSSR